MSPDRSDVRAATPRPGYTLVEVLVVVAILAVLVGLLVAAVQKVREAAFRVQCTNRVRQVALATHGFFTAHDYLPANAGTPLLYDAPGQPRSPSGSLIPGPAGSTLFHLLPFIDQEALWRQADAKNMSDAAARTLSAPAPFFKCPSRPGPLVADLTPEWRKSHPGEATDIGGYPFRHGLTDYAVNARLYRREGIGAGGIARPKPANFRDGLSNTVLLAEKGRGTWKDPRPMHGYQDSWAGADATFDIDQVDYVPNERGLATDAEYDVVVYNTGPWPADLFVTTVQMGAGAAHPAGVVTAACDGSVRTVRFQILKRTWFALCTPNGGETAAFPN